jgi:hypothetical protein
VTLPVPSTAPYPVMVRRALSADDATRLVGHHAQPHDPTVGAATIARDATTGAPVFAYLPVPGGVAELRAAVLATPWHHTLRGSRALVVWAGRLRAALRAALPEVADHDETQAQRVHPRWRLGASEPWSSAVVNRTVALPYHRDSYRLPVWSAMPILRRGMSGGHLHLPEYATTLPCRDGWAVFFPGYALVHGVTPMRPTREGGYRITVVYYPAHLPPPNRVLQGVQ